MYVFLWEKKPKEHMKIQLSGIYERPAQKKDPPLDPPASNLVSRANQSLDSYNPTFKL